MRALYYFEAHVTVAPVFDDALLRLQETCSRYGFRVADLLMQKRAADTPTRSRYDTFCTGRNLNFADLQNSMLALVDELTRRGVPVYRYKIEDTLFDSRMTAVCAVVERDGLVLGVSRKTNREDWGLPAGKLEGFETPEAACVRELAEETSLAADPAHLREVFRGPTKIGGIVAVTFLVRSWSGEPRDTGEGAVSWVTWDALKRGTFGSYNAAVALAVGAG